MGKVTCEACNKKCKGHAIKLAQDKYFHIKCFTCKECNRLLSTTSFYTVENCHYCVEDYNRLFLPLCHSCKKNIEEDAITALGNNFHRNCLTCNSCRKNFNTGDKINIFDGIYFCTDCFTTQQMLKPTKLDQKLPVFNADVNQQNDEKMLDQHKVLENGRPSIPTLNHLNSPDSEYSIDEIKMYTNIQEANLLSPISGTSGYKSENSFEKEILRNNIPHLSFMQYRSPSPGSTFSHHSQKSKELLENLKGEENNFGKFFTTSYLAHSDAFKKGASINYSRSMPPQHYHRPEGFSYKNVRSDLKKPKKGSKFILSQQRSTPVAEPYKPIKTQEPIKLSKLPDAHLVVDERPIERDDFPAPPEPAALCPELLREKRMRHRSGSRERASSRSHSRASNMRMPDVFSPVNGENKENVQCDIYNDQDYDSEEEESDLKLAREIEMLEHMENSGAAKIMIEDLKRRQNNPSYLNPRSASRTPSAANEPHYPQRYENSIFASPSRDKELRIYMRSSSEKPNIEYKHRTCSTPTPSMLPPKSERSMKSPLATNQNALNISSYRPGSAAAILYNRIRSASTDPSIEKRAESSAHIFERFSLHSSQSDIYELDPITGLRKTRPSLTDGGGRVTPISLTFSSSFKRAITPHLFVRSDEHEHEKNYTYDELKLSKKKKVPTATLR